MYVDCGPQTVASAYSIRPGGLVSAPVGWDELDQSGPRTSSQTSRSGSSGAGMKPMLAKLVADIPPGLYYEPKWDGFRAIVVKDGDAIEIHSRNEQADGALFPGPGRGASRTRSRRAAPSTARSS